MRSRNVIRVLCAAALVLLATSCRTTEPVWFIATPGYVEAREEALREEYDRRIYDLELEIAAQRQRADQLSREVAEARTRADELEGLATIVREVESGTRALQELAYVFEQEIRLIPEQTIHLIVAALTGHLERAE